MFIDIAKKFFYFINVFIKFFIKLIIHLNTTLPIIIFITLYLSWNIYECFHMNWDVSYNYDLVDKWVSKYVCPPLCFSRIFWNFFKILIFFVNPVNYQIIFENIGVLVNLNWFFLISFMFLLLIILIKIIKNNSCVKNKLINNLFYCFSFFKKNESFVMFLKKNKYLNYIYYFFN